MRVAVTGHSGFIGKHLCKALVEGGYELLPISRKMGTDITDADSLRATADFDVLVHLAARSFVPDSYRDPEGFYLTNVLGTMNVLELCRVRKASLIFMSSYLYGSPSELPVSESEALKPHNPYAHTKMIAEQMCQAYSKDFQLPVTVFRLFNAYGPGQDENFLIPRILSQHKSPRISLLDPRPRRDYIYVQDVVSALIAAIKEGNNLYDIFNLGTGVSHSVEELVREILLQTSSTAEVEFQNVYRENEVMDSRADIRKITKRFDWKPTFDLRSGLKEYIGSLTN